jgi:hypothetical protein
VTFTLPCSTMKTVVAAMTAAARARDVRVRDDEGAEPGTLVSRFVIFGAPRISS